jgi:type IV pilus assembly protein PilY1
MENRKVFFLYICWMFFIITPSLADDTDIFSGSTINVPPNILILLDTSGSMQEDDKKVPSSTYYPSHNYREDLDQIVGGTPEQFTVYYIRKEPNKEWEKSLFTELCPSTADIGCADAKTALDTHGYWMGFMHPERDEETGKYECGGETLMKLSTGNFRNFLASPTTESKYRITIAKDVIMNLVEAIDDSAVRIGLMRFDDEKDDGGKVLLPIGASDAQFEAIIKPVDPHDDKMLAKGTTPVAEALAEAGRYFAGTPNWTTYLGSDDTTGIIDGGSYISPVQWRCQKNYVVVVSDGLSYNDNGKVSVNDTSMFLEPYINNNTIAEYATTGIDLTDDGTDVIDTVYPGAGTHLLDDVAEFLYDEDLLVSPATDSAGESYDHEYFPKQNIITYTVGFMTASGTEITSPADELLMETARNGGGHDPSLPGGGNFFSADNSTDLEEAFLSIVGMILAVNSSFIAPVVPVNKINKVYSGNSVYLSLFKPNNAAAFWYGNLKKFGLDSDGYLLQKDGTSAIDDTGEILDTASSCWSYSSGDGSTTELGGAGAVIYNTSASRKFYTYGGGVTTSLTASDNEFSSDGSTQAVKDELGVDDPADLIDFLTAQNAYAKGGALDREWVLGDILHSKPATMFYNDNYTLIFVGSNDGFLHVFVDYDGGDPDDLSIDTLSEAWCFVPWDLLPNLHILKDSTQHSYFVDGTPLLYHDGGYQYVIFGLRRGGNKYYSLKVGNVDANGDYTGGYTSPEFAWEIAPNILGDGSEQLGQSWCKPRESIIATNGGGTNKVLMLTGGYDADNEDLDLPANGDSKGRAIFAVDATTGALQNNLNFNHSTNGDIDYCIVELVDFDFNNNGINDTIFAGSLGGNLFAFSDRNEDGTWTKVHVFQARSDEAGTTNSLLKFMTAPDVTMEIFGDYVYIGTGDRAHPAETSTTNRFYAIRNTWASDWTTLTEADLIDVTSYSYSSELYANLETGNGWYIKLNERSGEKVMSSPLTFNKIVFFTTYAPEPSGELADKCSLDGLGGGRLYALDYLTGEAALNFDTTNDTEGGQVLEKSDRSTSLGVGIPSPPTLIVTEDGEAKLIIGTAGPDGDIKPQVIDIPGGSDVERYYWKNN